MQIQVLMHIQVLYILTHIDLLSVYRVMQTGRSTSLCYYSTYIAGGGPEAGHPEKLLLVVSVCTCQRLISTGDALQRLKRLSVEHIPINIIASHSLNLYLLFCSDHTSS